MCLKCSSSQLGEVEPRVYFSLMPLPTTEHIVGAQEMAPGRPVARAGPDQALILSPFSTVSQLEHGRAGVSTEAVSVAVLVCFPRGYD